MYERILTPIDGSDASLRGLREAVALALLLVRPDAAAAAGAGADR